MEVTLVTRPDARPLLFCAGDLQDLHVYDPTSMAWTDLSASASGTPPPARNIHGFTTAGGKLYEHGGRGESGEGCRAEGGKLHRYEETNPAPGYSYDAVAVVVMLSKSSIA